MTKGIALNNPFDLEVNPNIQWEGEIPTTDPTGIFCQFSTPYFGIRAGMMDLRNQQVLHGLNDIEQIIEKFAPPSENNTLAYVSAIVAALKVGSRDPINLSDPSFLAKFGKAVIVQEQGYNPYPDTLINQAVVEVTGKPLTTGEEA